MPALPLCQRLLFGVLKYACHLQKLRHQKQKQEADGSHAESQHCDIDGNNGDGSSFSSISSFSLYSSLSSLEPPGQHQPTERAVSEGQFSSDEEEDDQYIRQMHLVQDHIKYLTETCVLWPNKVHKLFQLYLVLELFKQDDPSRFQRNLHVSPETFDTLVSRIDSHPVFASEGLASQMPVPHQLAIALFCFGHFGNSTSMELIAQWAGVSARTVVNATRRVMVVFLSLHDEVIHWPSAREKEEAKAWVEAVSCIAWRDGWLLVDGTLVPLAEKPAYHREAYFDRKSNYSLNVQVRLNY